MFKIFRYYLDILSTTQWNRSWSKSMTMNWTPLSFPFHGARYFLAVCISLYFHFMVNLKYFGKKTQFLAGECTLYHWWQKIKVLKYLTSRLTQILIVFCVTFRTSFWIAVSCSVKILLKNHIYIYRYIDI